MARLDGFSVIEMKTPSEVYVDGLETLVHELMDAMLNRQTVQLHEVVHAIRAAQRLRPTADVTPGEARWMAAREARVEDLIETLRA